MTSMEEMFEMLKDIREDISYMKRHRNMLCGMPILEVAEVCDLLKMSDRQLRRYRTSGQLTGFRFGRRLLFPSAEITQFIERTELDYQRRKQLKKAIRNIYYPISCPLNPLKELTIWWRPALLKAYSAHISYCSNLPCSSSICAAKATVRCSSHRIKFVRLWGSTAINWSNTDVSALLGNTVKLSPKKRRKMPP